MIALIHAVSALRERATQRDGHAERLERLAAKRDLDQDELRRWLDLAAKLRGYAASDRRFADELEELRADQTRELMEQQSGGVA